MSDTHTGSPDELPADPISRRMQREQIVLLRHLDPERPLVERTRHLQIGYGETSERLRVREHQSLLSWESLLLYASVRESTSAWTDAIPAVLRLRRESRSLRREREQAIRSLGDAAHREDELAVSALRARVRKIDELAERDRERAAAVARARQHVDEERAAASATQEFSVDDLTSGGNADK